MKRKPYDERGTLRLNDLLQFEPLSPNQEKTYRAWKSRKAQSHLILSGSAGTGKTFVGMYLALESVLDRSSNQEKLCIVRSIVPTREIGFLPGTAEEKYDVYKSPYVNICSQLFGNKIAYSILEEQGVLEFISTSFIRGTTFDNTVILVDECQNLTFHELDSIVTRAGINTRIILCGDYYQSDFTRTGDRNGIKEFLNILEQIKEVHHIEFTWEDIVRSDFVREYIMTKEMLRRQHE